MKRHIASIADLGENDIVLFQTLFSTTIMSDKGLVAKKLSARANATTKKIDFVVMKGLDDLGTFEELQDAIDAYNNAEQSS